MTYYDNSGMIPTWLINWAASTGGPQYLKLMHKSCAQYLQWRETADKNSALPTRDGTGREFLDPTRPVICLARPDSTGGRNHDRLDEISTVRLVPSVKVL